MSKKVILTATDDNYILPLLVMLYSAKINTRHDFFVVIGYISEDLSSENRALVSSVLHYFQIDFEFRNIEAEEIMMSFSHITRTSSVRLALMDKMSGIAVWMDADLVCLPGWDQIFDFSLNEFKNALAAGVVDPLVTHPSWQQNSINRAVIEMGNDYINAGVLLINCDLWNELEMPKMWRIAASNYDNLGFQVLDQCVLNFLVKDSYALLPAKFNFLASMPQRIPFNDVCIIHFAGTSKPWHFSQFDLRSTFSTLKSRDIKLYKTFQNNLIREIRESSEAEFLVLSTIASCFIRDRSLMSHIKARIYVISFTYPHLRKLVWLRNLLTRLLLKTFKGSKNI